MLRAALFQRFGCGVTQPALDDFPPLVLAEVAAEMRSEYGAYTILRESARAAAPGSGFGAHIAAGHLGDDFDSKAAQAVQTGLVIVDMTPEEVALGVLPILSFALYVWFREHRPAANATSTVVVAAQETSLSPDGAFSPYDGLRAFRRAYQATQISGETFNIDLVYHALVRAVKASLPSVGPTLPPVYPAPTSRGATMGSPGLCVSPPPT